jgi:segregation and condensation protein B
VQNEDAWQMQLIPELKSLEAGFQGEVRPVRLGQSAIDVLAIVAYHQPVSRAEVDRIWQRPCGAVLSQLVQRQLIALDSSTGPLRDRKFTTTDRFLGMIGLDSIGDLPQTAEISDMEDMLEG